MLSSCLTRWLSIVDLIIYTILMLLFLLFFISTFLLFFILISCLKLRFQRIDPAIYLFLSHLKSLKLHLLTLCLGETEHTTTLLLLGG